VSGLRVICKIILIYQRAIELSVMLPVMYPKPTIHPKHFLISTELLKLGA
jgi:hypothetical protein